MRYSAKAKQFTLEVKDFEFISMNLLYAIKQIRLVTGLPMDRYKQDGPLERQDYAMRAIIEIGNLLDIDLGSQWGNELDVREVGQ